MHLLMQKGTVLARDIVHTPVEAPLSNNSLTGDQIMSKCLESSAINSPSTRELIDFLDSPSQHQTNSQSAANALSTSGCDNATLVTENSAKDIDIPVLPTPVRDVEGFINSVLKKSWSSLDPDGTPMLSANSDIPTVPMDQTTLDHVDLGPDAQDVEIIIVPD